ncbi:MurR/RpiR family transcriptional regulator [Streptococcus sp. 121]|uniref:MurR/RpiR family transcriptional regulator n=1 Tax=unclassified Streptococcus TaxID=2608887 RepID=UPI0018CB5250|nr:MurR/RpiR family transcriptional regulator [Streptococcus sp. 121]MBG9367845.1 MurR/RpiR family transcriptional regulator [Streptococcus sp. NLN64]MBJ6745833.1 MurR/RpiR family transcriptional regulator [Streptococcus sp. 121]
MKFLPIKRMIELHYDELTCTEKDIADFFLESEQSLNFLRAQCLAKHLHVSESSLTRFAQKCGFSGYREFIYQLKEQQEQMKATFNPALSSTTIRILSDYEQILDTSQSLLSEVQIDWMIHHLEQAKRVYFYGKGFSGLVAREFSIRFLRLGLVSEAIIHDDMLHWIDGVIDESCLVIGLSVSGQTQSVRSALEKAKKKGASTCLITTQYHRMDYVDCLFRVASTRHLNYGNRISPQLPLSIALDVVFAYFLDYGEREKKQALYERSLIPGDDPLLDI